MKQLFTLSIYIYVPISTSSIGLSVFQMLYKYFTNCQLQDKFV